MPLTETGDLGPQAAWRYLRLALHALLQPVLAHLPSVSLATRLYLLFNVCLYAIAAAAFLLPALLGVHVGHTGLAAVDDPALHILWGLTALGVSGAQLAALLSDRWTIWQFCAVSTAMWASAWAVVTLLMAHSLGNYGGAVLWLWVVGIHFLFISNQLVPHHAAQVAAHDADEAAEVGHHTPEEEAALIAELARVASAPHDENHEPKPSPRPRPRRVVP